MKQGYSVSFVDVSEASRISGMAKRTIEHCLSKYNMLPNVVINVGPGNSRLYSERDVHVLLIARRLLDMGFELKKINEIVKETP